MEISIEELFNLIDVCDTAGRQSAIEAVETATAVEYPLALIDTDEYWCIPTHEVAKVADRLGVEVVDLLGALYEVDNT